MPKRKIPRSVIYLEMHKMRISNELVAHSAHAYLLRGAGATFHQLS